LFGNQNKRIVEAAFLEQKPDHEVSIEPHSSVDQHIYRLIAGVTGASGSIYGWRLLQKLRSRKGVEVHLILSRAGERTAYLEMGKQAADFRALADCWHAVEDISSPLASGSFRADAMVIAPCSIHTMSSIAAGISSNLMIRAADVTLKQRRPLILMVRETPLHLGHLRSLTALAEMGAVVAPPVPAFYHRPRTVEELVDDSVDRVLDLLSLAGPETRRWEGPVKGTATRP
jgi:flavin prenyltransferase